GTLTLRGRGPREGPTDHIIPSDQLFVTIFAELVDQRLLKTHIAGVRGKDEITAIGERDLHCPLEGQLDQIRISARRDDEVVFQLPLIAVIDAVNPEVEVSALELGIRGGIGAPLVRIVHYEL